jgi:hypothetical protein
VPKEVAARIRACRELATLDRWIRRAAQLERLEELFE